MTALLDRPGKQITISPSAAAFRTKMSTTVKIHTDPRDLAPRIDALRQQGKIIVFGNGCFDLLHVGHIRYLEAARALGDVLIIAVNTDHSIRLNRNRQSPLTPEAERMEMIAALSAVDYVVPLDDSLPNALIELFRPHFQAKGTDYSLEKMPERETVERCGGRIVFVGDAKNHSSTEIRRALGERGSMARSGGK